MTCKIRRGGVRAFSSRALSNYKEGGGLPLNERQRRFADEYPIDLNATQAAIRAGYSEKTAYSVGHRLLKNVEIQKCIQARLQDRAERTEITQDKVLKELAKIGFADAADYADSQLKYSNKIKALLLVGKHLGMFERREDMDIEDIESTRKEVFGDD